LSHQEAFNLLIAGQKTQNKGSNLRLQKLVQVQLVQKIIFFVVGM